MPKISEVLSLPGTNGEATPKGFHAKFWLPRAKQLDSVRRKLTVVLEIFSQERKECTQR